MDKNKKYLIIAGVLTALVVISKAREVITKDLNPADPDNIINRGFESVYQTVTGSNGTLGGDIYDILHDQNGGNVLNPANGNNPINRGVEGAYQWATGSKGTIGGDIYDVLHDQQGRNRLNPFNWFD